jgi:hypothetical protein
MELFYLGENSSHQRSLRRIIDFREASICLVDMN